jgi:thiol:disulfide interchange protein DsbD
VLAFAGGLILNLMPCVLPVLSLKVFGIIHSAQQAKSTVIRHGLLFTFGVLLSFWILAGTLILLQAGGEQLGWGFQLQSPGFIVVLSSLLFLFGLNLLGVFEIGTSLTALGQKGEHSNGNISSFFNGVLATIVATPCTAPFMGSALGYSLSQPPFVAMLIFTALGLGMAAPYLLISFVPNLARVLPKPGAWMETLKQVMGFLLLATVIWLLYVLSQQVDSLGVMVFLGCLLLLGVAGWVLGRWGTLATANSPRKFAKGIAAIVVIASVLLGIYITTNLAGPSESSATEGVPLAWQPFSPTELERLRQENKPVFIDFTAAWCLSCKVNERIALYNDQVVAAFKERGITPMKADWTNRDATIAQTLATYGRNSVPLYLLFKAGESEPMVLPEILTPGIVLEALQKTEQDIIYE